MVPATVSGLLVFLASVGPGYLYVRVADLWRPAAEKTALREAAELVVSGALATLAGVIAALFAAKQDGFLDATKLIDDPSHYIVNHPGRVGGGIAIVLLVSYGLAFLIARYSPGRGARVYSDSAWYGTFERRLPGGHGTVATVELRDGRAIKGVVAAFTAEATPVDDRELVVKAPLTTPLKARTANGHEVDLAEDFLLLRGSDVVYIAASYRQTQG